jgi:hypothetical protein
MSAKGSDTRELRTEVDGDIICEVARKHGMGAGSLKGALEFSHREHNERMEVAMREAIRTQAEREGIESPV